MHARDEQVQRPERCPCCGCPVELDWQEVQVASGAVDATVTGRRCTRAGCAGPHCGGQCLPGLQAVRDYGMTGEQAARVLTDNLRAAGGA